MTGSNLYLATTTGKSVEGRGFLVEAGGFGILQYLIRDQNVIYSPLGYVPCITRRHACNIWYHNDELEARVERWVIDVFNQESEAALIPLRDYLIQETGGEIEFRLICRRGPVRPEKTLADYGLGIRK